MSNSYSNSYSNEVGTRKRKRKKRTQYNEEDPFCKRLKTNGETKNHTNNVPAIGIDPIIIDYDMIGISNSSNDIYDIKDSLFDILYILIFTISYIFLRCMYHITDGYDTFGVLSMIMGIVMILSYIMVNSMRLLWTVLTYKYNNLD